jgi:hypothetical protein
MRDGRLSGAERSSFERHTRACAACSREVEAFEALAGALRAGAPVQTDELRVRRERTRLLAAFDRELVAPKGEGTPRRPLLWFAAAAGLLGVLIAVRSVRPHRGLPVAVAAPGAVVHADAATVWSERVEGDREVVVLERGALWIRVEHATSSRRLVVVLPDGELEDTGTTFTVGVDGGHTTRVAVQEGSVVLRLRDRPAVAVGAGDAWTPPAAPTACAGSEERGATPPPVPTPSGPPAFSAPPPRAGAPGSDSSADFRVAMAALDRGDDREAAEGFARFLQSHPRDARAEDAAYLLVIASQREGDQDATRRAAQGYLRRYPGGFRRAEVEKLAQ